MHPANMCRRCASSQQQLGMYIEDITYKATLLRPCIFPKFQSFLYSLVQGKKFSLSNMYIHWLNALTTVMLTKDHKNYATNIDICSKKQGLIPY